MEGSKKRDSEEYYEDMLDGGRVRELDPFGWECSSRLLIHEEEPVGMYPEERDGRKRKWEEIGGKMMRKEDEQEREQRKMPPKKILSKYFNLNLSLLFTTTLHPHVR
ncbi:hypothetical protein EVAR_86588_1 [Eumeta japonica]|uniref:Uncharacterized protein n=1 Tax=Eumeta variegata TaxID=151549 RepID=A0A4C1W138_EUMVA|nr:hypothetical protein EVAR_86588_1 [Eumeta japonica]